MALVHAACVTILLLFSCGANCDDEHLICKRVGEAFTAPQCANVGPEGRVHARGYPGKVGPIGFPGLKGVKGQKGDGADVDYNMINARIEDKIDAAMRKVNRKLNAKLIKLETTFTNSIEKLREGFRNNSAQHDKNIDGREEIRNNSAQDGRKDLESSEEIRNNSALDENCRGSHSGIRYSGHCFWLVLPEETVNFAEGRALCRDKGGKVAGIQNSEQYVLVTSYIRSMIPKRRSYIQIWLGMTINPQTRVVSLLDGTSSTSTYVSWYPGNPSTYSGDTHIYIKVRKLAGDGRQGMLNSIPPISARGMLCQSIEVT